MKGCLYGCLTEGLVRKIETILGTQTGRKLIQGFRCLENLWRDWQAEGREGCVGSCFFLLVSLDSGSCRNTGCLVIPVTFIHKTYIMTSVMKCFSL